MGRAAGKDGAVGTNKSVIFIEYSQMLYSR
jgi:hypothetical protein